MSSSKKIDLEMDFAAVVCLAEAQNPISPPPYILYTCMKYTYLFTQGRGGVGRVESERMLER
jgi:hypothetical protein